MEVVSVVEVEVVSNRVLLPPQIFQGNHNPTDEVRSFLPKPTLARYIRIRPLTWEQGICMRLEIYGCRTSGSTAVFDARLFERSTHDGMHANSQNQTWQTYEAGSELNYSRQTHFPDTFPRGAALHD